MLILKKYNFIYACLNSYNTIIKATAFSSGGSALGDNQRYHSYTIVSHILTLNEVTKCISLYISTHDNLLHSAHDTIIHDLCLARDNYYQST